MKHRLTVLATLVVALAVATPLATAQLIYDIPYFVTAEDSLCRLDDRVEDGEHAGQPGFIERQVIVQTPLKGQVFMPMVFTGVKDFSGYDPFAEEITGQPWTRWIEEAEAAYRNGVMLQQRVALKYPGVVRYNINTLPRAPKKYVAKVNPKKHMIEIEEVEFVDPGTMQTHVRKRHWLRTFNSSLQFSQAYVSPNWYQGGNNNLNMLINVFYNVKLNNAYHPNLLFETTMQYKLGLNSAPDDSLRNYSISEDLLQLNATFGVKATKRWYYSVNAQFKTQVLNSYVKNTRRLSSAFLSPGEFNAGLGMTYNYVNKRKTFKYDMSVAPVSYNMKICVRPDSIISHNDFGIKPDRDYTISFGSTAECKMTWQMASNIKFTSRLFAFTNYDYVQADWENTLAMDINRFLTTQIYCHARYDTSTPRCEDRSWHKLQVKEILSFGIAYKFSSI